MGKRAGVLAGFRLTTIEPTEAMVLSACKDLLARHRTVGMWWRNQVGKGYVLRPKSGAHIKAQIDRAVQLGCFTRDQVQWLEWGVKGASDLMATVGKQGRLAAIEVKRPGGTATAEQDAFLELVRRSGGIGLCIHDAMDLNDILNGVADV